MAFIHRGVHPGFCPPGLLSIDELVSNVDDKLFNCITSDEHHVFFCNSTRASTLCDCGYSLRLRIGLHTRTLVSSKSWLDKLNFIPVVSQCRSTSPMLSTHVCKRYMHYALCERTACDSTLHMVSASCCMLQAPGTVSARLMIGSDLKQ